LGDPDCGVGVVRTLLSGGVLQNLRSTTIEHIRVCDGREPWGIGNGCQESKPALLFEPIESQESGGLGRGGKTVFGESDIGSFRATEPEMIEEFTSDVETRDEL